MYISAINNQNSNNTRNTFKSYRNTIPNKLDSNLTPSESDCLIKDYKILKEKKKERKSPRTLEYKIMIWKKSAEENLPWVKYE